MSTLKLLKQLTAQIPEIGQFMIANGTPSQNLVEYKVRNGNCFSQGLLYSNDITVATVYFSKGSIFETHVHSAREWLIVYQGSLKVIFTKSGKEKIISRGDSVYIPPNTPHMTEALKETRVIALTIPGDKGFPNARA